MFNKNLKYVKKVNQAKVNLLSKRNVHLSPTVGKQPINTTAEEAMKIIKSNSRIFVHTAAATPNVLINKLIDRADEVDNIEFCHLHTEGKAPYAKEQFKNKFKVNSFFVGANVRTQTNDYENVSYIPIFLSEVPKLFKENILPLDYALVQVSPPDSHGFCSLGVSIDTSVQALISAKKVIAQVNPNMPRTHGDGIVHVSNLDYIVPVDVPIYEAKNTEMDELSEGVGKNVANLIENGSCLQMGIGTIPNAVLSSLTNHERLGIHTEMMSDGVVDLVSKGVITGEDKKLGKNDLVVSFCVGSRKVYDFIHDNPIVKFKTSDYTNDPYIISQNQKMVAINSCIEIDLTGQVNADSIGSNIFSGVGGQLDFMRGAAMSEGGKPIFAVTSVTSKGTSKIVPFLKRGAGVTTTRSHVHWVVTEYGSAYLFGKNLYERARALANIAHPNHRPWLNWCIDKHYWKYWDNPDRFNSQKIQEF